MDIPTNSRQRTSPANDSNSIHHQQQQPQQLPHHQQQQQQQQQQLLHQQQQLLLAQAQQHPQGGQFSYPVQQQPQGSWTPNITAPPFYPSFYQNQQQQQPPQPYAPPTPYFDPANAQLAAQWAYQQMMFNAQHGFPTMTPPQRPPNSAQSSSDYFPPNQIPQVFSPFPSGTPPPHAQRADQGQQQQQQPYPGFHPYRRPNRQPSQQSDTANEWRHVPHPPYARPDASGSTSSLNSSSSSRQRTNSNQSAHSSGHNVPISASARGSPGSGGANSARNTPSPAGSPSSSAPSPFRQQPHHRNSSTSSSTSTSTATSGSTRPSPLSPSLPTTATSSASTSTASVTTSATTTSNGSGGSATPRLTRPSPLSQGTFTASEKRMSRDDIDLGAMHHSDSTPSASMIRSGGLKGRLRRALSFNAAQALKEEEAAAAAAEEDDDDDVSIKASQLNSGASSSKLKARAPATVAKPADSPGDDGASTTATVQTKKKGRAASLFNSRLNASTDNISLSSTVSSASVMIRKLGAMGKLARRNSLAGITSLFKDKDKDKDKEKDGDKKGKKKEKKGAKAEASEASVSHVTAELDRMGNDWTVGTEMNGLSPAAKLARQHTLKSNAEAAAKAKEAAAAASAREAAATSSKGASGVNGTGAGVPTWDRNTATRQGSLSPVKGAGVRINEDGTRTLIEEDEEESDDGHYAHHQGSSSSSQGGFRADGWDDDEDWDGDGDGDEDVTIRVGVEPRSSSEDDQSTYGRPSVDVEPWAVDIRRSVERSRKPAKGILKRADSYDQQVYLQEQATLNHRARSNSYNAQPQTELGPLARIPSPDPDHIDGLHRHPSHSSTHGASSADATPPSLPPLSFDSSSSPISVTFSTSKDLPSPPHIAQPSPHPSTHQENRSSAIFQHPNFNSSAPALSTMGSAGSNYHPQPPLAHRSATAPVKRLTFATNLSVYDTFSASVYDRRSEPATWSRLTPALAQRIKEELNSYKMEEMEVHAASRIHTQFFV